MWGLAQVLRGLAVLGVVSVGVRADAEVVERVLAVVDDRPVPLSEVQALARLRGLDEAAALEATIDAYLMFAEARRRPVEPPPEAEGRAYADLTARWPADAGRPPEAALWRLARRETRILEYVARRFASQLRVSDEALAEALAAVTEGRVDAQPLPEVEQALRERLARKALDERIEAWVKELRASAEIRLNP
jgi:hypothetical protein